MAIARIEPYEIPSAGDWPACRAAWPLEPMRAALLVHDMQEYFLRPFAPDASPLSVALRNVEALRAACGEAAVPIFFSVQPEQDRSGRGLLWDLWGPGISESPALIEVDARLGPGLDDVILPKRRYSAFHGTDLFAMLAARKRDQLVICGVYGHIGCLATALDGFMGGVQPFLVADAVADFSREDHAVALRQVARTCGVVATAEEVLLAMRVARVRAALDGLLDPPASAAAIGVDDDLGDHGIDSIRLMSLAERLLRPDHGHDFVEIADARSLRSFATLLAPAAQAAR